MLEACILKRRRQRQPGPGRAGEKGEKKGKTVWGDGPPPCAFPPFFCPPPTPLGPFNSFMGGSPSRSQGAVSFAFC